LEVWLPVPLAVAIRIEKSLITGSIRFLPSWSTGEVERQRGCKDRWIGFGNQANPPVLIGSDVRK
jgi:hypothetical protein